MKIQKSEVTKISISEVDGLDTIQAIIEDIGPRQGRITIQCYDEIWSSFWGGMGDKTISEFFCSCDNQYLIGKLSYATTRTVNDLSALGKLARMEIGKRIKQKDLSKDDAVQFLEELNAWDEELCGSIEYSLFSKIFGNWDWMYDIPQQPNYRYDNLSKIIDAVKEAFNTQKSFETA